MNQNQQKSQTKKCWPVSQLVKKWLEDRFPNGSPECEYELQIGDQSIPSVKADLHAEVRGAHLFVEEESGATSCGHFDANVDKYWPWFERKKDDLPAILIQVINPRQLHPVKGSDRNYLSRVEIARFIGEKLRQTTDEKFRYVLINLLDEWKKWELEQEGQNWADWEEKAAELVKREVESYIEDILDESDPELARRVQEAREAYARGEGRDLQEVLTEIKYRRANEVQAQDR